MKIKSVKAQPCWLFPKSFIGTRSGPPRSVQREGFGLPPARCRDQSESTMRLGTDTGSLANHVISTDRNRAAPVIGMGATILLWTDRHACTIVAVDPMRRWVDIQRDHAKRVDSNGMSDSQKYTYERNPNATIERFTLRNDGRYVRKGDAKSGTGLSIGNRQEFYDHSF
jgi:hypothetical protein